MHPSISHRHARWVQALACLFIALLLADLTLDSSCDPAPQASTSATASVVSGSHEDADACAEGCVPDCYCCSSSVAPTTPILTPDAVPEICQASVKHLAAPVGVRPTPYRPPIHLV